MVLSNSIQDIDRLVENGGSGDDRYARRLVLDGLNAALSVADPISMVRSAVKIVDNILKIDALQLDLSRFRRIFVIGGGKASGYMAQKIEAILNERITDGCINILEGTLDRFRTERISLNEAGHPLPTEDGRRGVEKILSMLKDLSEDDLVLCLISGGASSLMPLPKDGISLEDYRAITKSLLKAGANIHELNSVRKHLSKVKGGQLAAEAYPATVVSLIISDVVADDLDVIASGPTAPDRSTYRDAVDVLKKYELWKSFPLKAKQILEKGLKGIEAETPKAGDKVFERVHNIIIGSNRTACNAAEERLKMSGLPTIYLTSHLEGEAREVGGVLASLARGIEAGYSSISRPIALIAGGETTVTVRGEGRGGRNMELVLGSSLKIRDLNGVAIASMGTDGIDGPTDAAGAIGDGQTVLRAEELGLDSQSILKDNNSYEFFERLDDLLKTGPTGTNVNDVMILVVL